MSAPEPSPAVAARWARRLTLPAVALAVGLGAYGALALLGGDAPATPTAAPAVAGPAPVAAAQAAASVAAVAAAPAAAAVADPRPVAGTLIDRAGRPIAGARVEAVDAAGLAVDAASITDAAGSFRFVPAALASAAQLRLSGAVVAPAELAWLAGGPAPRIIATRLVTLAVRVGVPGAVVHVRAGGRADVVTVIAAADGVARTAPLAAAPYELWAEGGGQASPLVRVDAAAGDAEVRVAMAPAGQLRGQLTGPGAAGATLVLSPTTGDAAPRTATADAGGAFAVDALLPGAWQLTADGAGGYLAQAVTIGAGAATDVQAALRPTGRLVGAVVDDLGAPVAGATIIVQGAGAPAAALGEVGATGWVHPLTGERQLPLRDSRRFGAERPGPRPAECGAGHCGVDLGTERGKVVHAVAAGTVAMVFPEVRGRAGRYVAVDHAGGLRTFYMHLDEVRGDLQVGASIAAGEPLGTVGTSGVHVSGPHLHFALAQVQDGRSWYLDPEALLLGAVVMPTDRALGSTVVIDDGVRIATVRSDGGAGVAPASAGPRGVSDARGSFAVGQLRPGTYSALVVAPGLIMGRSAQVTIAAGADSAPVRVTLSAGVTVQGVITGPDGPVRGAQVTAVAATEVGSGEVVQQLAAAVTDDLGRYQLRAVTGAVTLTVSAAGFATSQRDIVLGRADLTRRTRDEDVTLVDARARLHGEVRDDDGAPLGGVVVRVTRGPTSDRRTVSAPDGSFRISGVVDGSYQLELVAPGRAPQPAGLRSEAFTTLVLSQGATLAVAVGDRHTGRPLPATVRVAGPGGAAQTLTCDAAGNAIAPHLAPGRWTLEVSAAGFVTERRTVDVAGRRPAPVRIELGRGALIAGVVRDGYGQRVAGARVRLGSAEGTTNGNGEFRLRDAPTGELELRVELGERVATQALTLAPGDERVTLVVDLP